MTSGFTPTLVLVPPEPPPAEALAPGACFNSRAECSKTGNVGLWGCFSAAVKDLLDVLGQRGQSSRSPAAALSGPRADPPAAVVLLRGPAPGLGNAILRCRGWKRFVLETLL